MPKGQLKLLAPKPLTPRLNVGAFLWPLVRALRHTVYG